MMIVLFLLGCAFGFLLGTMAGAIAAGLLYQLAGDGIATTSLLSSTADNIENPISPPFSWNITATRPDWTLPSNPERIDPASAISELSAQKAARWWAQRDLAGSTK